MIFAFAWLLSSAVAPAAPTDFLPVDDYRRVHVETTAREPEGLTPLYRNSRARVISLDLFVGVADRASSAFVRARYRVHRRDGSPVEVDTGLCNLGFTDAATANFAVRLRVENAVKRATFANLDPIDAREPMFTEPAVVLFTGSSVPDFYHEISIGLREADFDRLDRDFEVEIRLKHQRDVHDAERGIDEHLFAIGRARPKRVDVEESRMINQLTFLARCEPGLVAH